MALPIIAIIGRPNVGKSTLFNRISGKGKAIVRDFRGVTRDRNYTPIEWDGRAMTLVDTGGFFPDDEDLMFALIRQQSLYAIEEADVIIHVLDGKEGLSPHDLELANIIRTAGKPVIWAVNKVDTHDKVGRVSEFYAIGSNEVFPVSGESGYGVDELMEKVVAMVPAGKAEAELEYPRVAIVGRPNVGKSTLVNQLLGKDRMIVSNVAGTTRDAIDSLCTYYKRKYLLIDTAGIRRRTRVDEQVEKMSVVRSLGSIERADIAVIVMDATDGIVDQDQYIVGEAVKREKGIILVFNKWDLVPEPDEWFEKLMGDISYKLWYAVFAPVLTISALDKRRISKLYPLIDQIMGEASKRIPTAALNEFKDNIEAVLPSHRGKKTKLYFMTQVGVKPPAFALFVNFPEGIKPPHVKSVERIIRERYAFTGTPIRIHIRRKS